MKTKFYKQIFAVLLLLLPAFVHAQAVDNLMRSSNRIYVVISVLVLILAVLILYLVRVERKIKNLEK